MGVGFRVLGLGLQRMQHFSCFFLRRNAGRSKAQHCRILRAALGLRVSCIEDSGFRVLGVRIQGFGV